MLRFISHQVLNSTAGSSVAYSLTIPTSLADVQAVHLQPLNSRWYYRLDATAPTSATGHVLDGTTIAGHGNNASVWLRHHPLADVQVGGDSSDLDLMISYYA